jgi:Xaa-Pro aminopeptidase
MYQVCVIPLKQDPGMILRGLDAPGFLEQAWVRDHVAYTDRDDPLERLGTTLKTRGWASARIGMDLGSHYLPVRRFEAIKTALPKATFVDFSRIIWELRLRKPESEITYLR